MPKRGRQNPRRKTAGMGATDLIFALMILMILIVTIILIEEPHIRVLLSLLIGKVIVHLLKVAI